MPAPAILGLLLALSGCAYRETRVPKSLIELRSQGAVLQRHEYSCGAAALATLMGSFGKPMEELEVLRAIFPGALPTETGPDGRQRLRALTLADLETGARAAGFKVVSLQVPDRKGLEEALEALKPAIARLSLYGDYLHFVVLQDIQDDWVLIADPGYGRIRLPKSQLFAAWEGGERILLAIGREPFEAWKPRPDRVYLRRADKDRPGPGEALTPMPLYRSVHQRLPQVTTLPR